MARGSRFGAMSKNRRGRYSYNVRGLRFRIRFVNLSASRSDFLKNWYIVSDMQRASGLNTVAWSLISVHESAAIWQLDFDSATWGDVRLFDFFKTERSWETLSSPPSKSSKERDLYVLSVALCQELPDRFLGLWQKIGNSLRTCGPWVQVQRIGLSKLSLGQIGSWLKI